MSSDPTAYAGDMLVRSGAGTSGGDPDTPAGPTAGGGRPRSLWSDAWRDLRRKPLFWVATVIIAFMILMAVWPTLFTSVNPSEAVLTDSLATPSGEHIFGRDVQGYDIYARAVHGAWVSIIVGVMATLGAALLGGLIGILAGFYGGFLDTVLSRVADVFLGLPFLLGAIVLLSTFAGPQDDPDKWTIIGLVVFALVLFGWPLFARMMRASVISVKNADYVLAARALGASNWRIIWRHLLPNCLAPMLVLASVSLGGYIGAEATLSFLGIGLRYPVISWGVMLNDAGDYVRAFPHTMAAPALFLSLTVLSFVLLGDQVREALDPKLR